MNNQEQSLNYIEFPKKNAPLLKFSPKGGVDRLVI